MYRRIFIIFLFVFIQKIAVSQNLYINNYTQKEYGSTVYTTSPQNWDIEQDSLGRLYIANASGVMLFDGLTWEMISGTENSNMYSLSKSSDNIIYAGGRNELGFFKSDSLGKVIFESLMPLMEKNDIEPGVIINVFSLEESVYFRNKNGLILFKDNAFTFYPVQSEYKGIEIIDEAIVVQDDFGNLLRLNNQQFDTLFSFGSALKSGVVSIFDIPYNQKLLFTAESGVFKISNGKLIKWRTKIGDPLSSLQIKEAINYPSLKLFGIATKSRGILFINYEGEIVKALGTKQGLNSNTCYNLFQDKNNELWTCFDNGIARIEFP